MSDDYLWDKSGEPDPEIAKLEKALSPLGHDGRRLDLPAAEAPRAGILGVWFGRERPPVAPDMTLAGVPARAWAMAASVLVVVGAVAMWFAIQSTRGWEVTRLDGAPSVGARRIAASGRLDVGEWVVTDASSRARVSIAKVGDVLVEPNTRLRLLEAGAKQQRLHLERGTVTALILAPPRQFVVETPSARAVDLGCAYTLEVDGVGGALVTVLAGWVSFEREGQESFIPAGARCATRPGVGPGTPYFADASSDFKNALAMLDVSSDSTERTASLRSVLAEARREDGLTLWHLLARLRGGDRDAVYDRLAVLVPPPAAVTRAGVMSGDKAMLDRWWDQLGFGEMKWWRLWQRGWPQPDASSSGPS